MQRAVDPPGHPGTLASMKRSLASVLALSLVACGGREEAPATITPVVETPTPTLTPTPNVTPTPTEVPTSNENEVELLEELEHERAQFTMMHVDVGYDRVAYAEPLQHAIEQQVRAIVTSHRDFFDNFNPSYGDSGNDPDALEMRCDVTLATAELVAYACLASAMTGRGESFFESSARAWEVVGETLREVELDDLLIAGTQFDQLSDSDQLTQDSPVAPSGAGLVFLREDGETEEIAYADLGALLNVHSMLSRIPEAVDASTERTELFEEARPPTSVQVLSPAQPFARAVLSASTLGTRWFFAEQGSAPIDVATPLVFDTSAAAAPAEGMTMSERAWSTPARFMMFRLKRPAQLRAGPRRPASGVMLPANTRLYGVLGELSAGPSRTGGGQWTLVVASEGLVGWLPSGSLQRVNATLNTGVTASAQPSVEAFLAALPEAERTAAQSQALGLVMERDAAGEAVVVYAPTATGSIVGVVPGHGPREVPALRAWLRHEGTLADARVVQPLGYGNDQLLLLAWLLPSDPTHHLWEAYTMPTDGLLAHEPAFSITLALPTASRRERVTVTTALRRQSSFYPFVVRGPGRTETLYTWNGTTLVAPPAE